MKEHDKERSEAKKEMEKAANDGIKKLTMENSILLIFLFKLKELLRKIEKFKALGRKSKVEELEKSLEAFEGLIDKKYWDQDALFYISMAIMCNVAKSLKEAISMYENFKNS